MYNATTVRILVNGKPIKIYTDSEGHSWIEAKEGSKYQIEVKNNSYNRVLCVTSVDGINVISGEEAEINSENGYIINPYSSLKIEGWRISDDKVKEFLFTYNKDKAYSVKLGAGKANLGVIGVAIFEEKPNYTYTTTSSWTPTIIWNNYTNTTLGSGTMRGLGISTNNCFSADAKSGYIGSSEVNCYSAQSADLNSIETNSLQSKSIDFKAGTAKGKERDSKVTEVSFIPGSLIQTHEIYYDSYDNLVKRGIISTNKMPKPFKNTKYCKDI